MPAAPRGRHHRRDRRRPVAEDTARPGAQQFWYPLGNLRSFFRAPGGENLEVLEKIGEHYRPNPAEITSDLWDFQAALGTAARAADDDQARAALHRAVATYRGDLLQGAGYSWVEPVRQDLHRRAVDAHLRLAELEDHAGRPDTAVDVLDGSSTSTATPKSPTAGS